VRRLPRLKIAAGGRGKRAPRVALPQTMRPRFELLLKRVP